MTHSEVTVERVIGVSAHLVGAVTAIVTHLLDTGRSHSNAISTLGPR